MLRVEHLNDVPRIHPDPPGEHQPETDPANFTGMQLGKDLTHAPPLPILESPSIDPAAFEQQKENRQNREPDSDWPFHPTPPWFSMRILLLFWKIKRGDVRPRGGDELPSYTPPRPAD